MLYHNLSLFLHYLKYTMSNNNLVASFHNHNNLAIVPRPRDDLPESIKGNAHWGWCFPQHECTGPTYFIVWGDWTYAIERLNQAWYQLAWDKGDETYYMNALQEVTASDPIHLKASKNSTPTTLMTMQVSQDITMGSEAPNDQPGTSKGKGPVHQNPANIHPFLFRQFTSVGPEPTMQMATNMEDFERQKRAWFHEWSTAQWGINLKFNNQVAQLLTQYSLAAPEQTHIQALQPHPDVPWMDHDVTHGSLWGNPPKTSDGDWAKANKFLIEFTNYWVMNDTNAAMVNPYHWTMITLGFIERPCIDSWKAKQLRQLQEDVESGTYWQEDEDHWTEFHQEFTTQFSNIVAKEKALCKFNTCGQKATDSINEYITTFNELMDKLGYKWTSDNITEKFKDGLLKTLLKKILDRDIWPETLDKWQNAAQCESCHSAYWSKW